MSYVGIILTFVFVNNIVLTQFLGLCPALGATKHFESTIGVGLATTMVAAITALLAWALDHFVLLPLGVGFLQLIAFVLAGAVTARGLDRLLRTASRTLYAAVGLYLPMVTANCAVLGVALIAVRASYDLIESLVAGAAAGVGTLVALLLLSSIRLKLESEWVPPALRGLPITLISAGLMSLAFMAFDRLVLQGRAG